MELKKPNILHLAVLIVGGIIFYISSSYNKNIDTFYGFAETKENEVNIDYPVIVDSLFVNLGQSVIAGQPLLRISYSQRTEQIDKIQMDINELEAKQNLWKAERITDMDRVILKKSQELAELDAAISELEVEARQKALLLSQMKSGDYAKEGGKVLANKIKTLKEERSLIEKKYKKEIENLQNEMYNDPYQRQIANMKRLISADNVSTLSSRRLYASGPGVVGDINCIEGERKQSFRTLITLYEANPTTVKGYVHEDLIVKISLNDKLLVSSSQNASEEYIGTVSGLGSRIVEIPNRLRKFDDVKSYGREVIISIPPKNDLLQKEKVVLNFIQEN